MSKILIHTLGSSGDFNPAVALALTLRERGHEITFAVNPARVASLDAMGFAAVPTGPDPDWNSDLMRRLLETGTVKPVEILFRESLIPSIRPAYNALLPLVGKSDLFLSHAIQLASHPLAFHTQVPWVTFMPPPACYPTAQQPPPGVAWQGCPAFLNRLSWKIGLALFQHLDALADEEYRALDVPPRPNIVLNGSYSQQLTLGLWSPAYCPRPSDWPDWFQVGGYARWDGPSKPGAPEIAVPQGGEPLVVFTLGSSVVNHPGAFFEIALEALRPTHWRGLLLGVPEGFVIPDDLRARVAGVSYAPYADVFPLADAVVHQGGVGTTQAACYYGKPAVIVPRGFDQFENAAHLQRNQWGLRLLPNDLSPALLRLRLERLFRSERIAQNVAALGERMRLEPGPAASADLLDAFLVKDAEVSVSPAETHPA